VAEVKSGGGGLVVGSHEEEAGELQGDVGKLEASSNGVGNSREQVLHDGQERRRMEIDGDRRGIDVMH
jgi:hypothetical protein